MTFDLLILGAGPAGCAAAIRAACGGLRVALIEKAAFPRDLPGEALHPNVDQLFAALGLTRAISRAGFVRCPGWIRVRTNERSFIPFDDRAGIRFGYQAWRANLDSILLRRARRAGVAVVQPATCSSVLLNNGRVSSVEVDGDSWFCRYLIDATGSNGWLARRLGLSVRRFSPKLVARYAYFENDRDLGMIPEFREHASGWTWLARVTKSHCQYLELSLDGSATPALPHFIPADVRLRGADVTWRLAPECAGPGYFLCGDAAAVLDPAASSGVARAMASGIKAADLIVQAAGKNTDASAATEIYRTWCTAEFIKQARQLAARYADFHDPPNWLRDLESRLGELEKTTSTKRKSLAKVASSVITSS